MARKKKTDERITLEEANRGVYVDCEGFMEKSPSLVGVLIEDQFEQVVLDPGFSAAAEEKGLRMSAFPAEAARIFQRAQEEARVVVGYSQHERNLFSRFGSLDLGDVYRDARMIAKRWKNALHRESPIAGWSLKDFLGFIGDEMPGYLGERKATSRLDAVRDMLRKRGSYDDLTAVVKAKWTKLLDYNRLDCEGMRTVVLKAAGEMEGRNGLH